jgi:hypothetical protein
MVKRRAFVGQVKVKRASSDAVPGVQQRSRAQRRLRHRPGGCVAQGGGGFNWERPLVCAAPATATSVCTPQLPPRQQARLGRRCEPLLWHHLDGDAARERRAAAARRAQLLQDQLRSGGRERQP